MSWTDPPAWIARAELYCILIGLALLARFYLVPLAVGRPTGSGWAGGLIALFALLASAFEWRRQHGPPRVTGDALQRLRRMRSGVY